MMRFLLVVALVLVSAPVFAQMQLPVVVTLADVDRAAQHAIADALTALTRAMAVDAEAGRPITDVGPPIMLRNPDGVAVHFSANGFGEALMADAGTHERLDAIRGAVQPIRCTPKSQVFTARASTLVLPHVRVLSGVQVQNNTTNMAYRTLYVYDLAREPIDADAPSVRLVARPRAQGESSWAPTDDATFINGVVLAMPSLSDADAFIVNWCAP